MYPSLNDLYAPYNKHTTLPKQHDRFVNGTKKNRDRQLEVFLQLGPGANLSPLVWAALKALSAVLNWSRRGENDTPFEHAGGYHVRKPFPGMILSNYTETNHFGGGILLQTDNGELPNNYVAVTSHLDGNKMSNMAARLLYQRLEDDALPAVTVDVSFVLKGEEKDELPERAMATIRLVNVDVANIALAEWDSDVKGDPKSTSHKLLRRLCSVKELIPEHPEEEEKIIRPGWVNWIESSAEFFLPSRRLRVQTEGLEEKPEEFDEDNMDSVDINLIEEPYRAGVLALGDVLDGVTVPVRSEGFSTTTTPQEPSPTCTNRPLLLSPISTTSAAVGAHADPPGSNVSVLKNFNRYDLRRFYVACGLDLKSTAVRMVETAAWRGTTFPIDRRECRIELQSGQLFHQGRDKNSHPVFYFQSMLLGPWRKDVNATISAVLYRLEMYFQYLAINDPDFKCTVIILSGEPLPNFQNNTPLHTGANPRVDSGETYCMHSNMTLLHTLIKLLSRHYPERLANVFLIPGKKGSGFLLNALGGSFSLRSYISDKRTRYKVKILSHSTELLQYVEKDQLVTFLGGSAPIVPEAFEF